jgi:hypothetical protein
MPKAHSATANPSSSESKPYLQPDGTALPTTPRKKPVKCGSSSPGKSQGWTSEDKQTLLFAVLATAKPDFNAIAKEKFGDKGRNANQVRINPGDLVLVCRIRLREADTLGARRNRSAVNGGKSCIESSLLSSAAKPYL